MKKLLAVGALALFAGMNAQVKFGAKAGLNVSTLSGDGDTKGKIGFLVGGLAEIKMNDKIAIQPELLLSTGGGQYTITESETYQNITATESLTQKFNLMNISVPVMVKYFINDSFSVEAGPQFGYMVSDKANINMVATAPGYTATATSDFNLSDKTITVKTSDGDTEVVPVDFQVQKFNIGLNFGAEYALPMGVFVNARYNLGLTPFVKNGNIAGHGEDPDARYISKQYKNSNIQLGVGYKF